MTACRFLPHLSTLSTALTCSLFHCSHHTPHLWRCSLLSIALLLPSPLHQSLAMPSHNQKKKKKKKATASNSSPATEDTTPPTLSSTPLASDAATPLSLATDSPPSIPSSTPPSVSYKSSAYERMSLHPITSTSSSFIPSPDSLSVKVSSLPLSHSLFSILHNPSDTTGRRAIARCPLSPGVLLIRETAFPSVLHQSYASSHCGWCYSPVSAGMGSGGGRGCRACGRVVYCSTACLMADMEGHREECRALKDLERISVDSQVHVDLVRAALAYAVARGRKSKKDGPVEEEDTAASVSVKTKATDFTPSFEDVEGMVAHESAVRPVDLSNMQKAAAALLTLLPPHLALPAPTLVSFMGRVNNNSHALSSSASPTSSAGSVTPHIGFGLFPLCSILNHSCYPNCIYVSEGRRMCMRVIRPVQQGEELTVNYVGLYSSLEGRRKELKDSKQFLCTCRRCLLSPADEEEKDKFSFDQYVGGILCRESHTLGKGKKRCGGIYRLMEPIVDDPFDGTTALPPLLCSECGAQLAYAELQAMEMEWGEKVEAALSLYSQQASTASQLFGHFTSLTQTLMQHFHPHHYLIFNITLPLINLLSALHQPRDRLMQVRAIRLLSFHVYPPHYLPSVNYAEAEVGAITQVTAASRMPPKLKAKYFDEQTTLMRSIIESLRICVGEDNEAVQREERRLQEHLRGVQ